jgi:SAM-dependent methyltransferase
VTASDAVSWSRLTDFRAECHARFGSILDLPIVDIASELKRLTSDARAVLDVGAGRDKPLRALLAPDAAYRTLDPDPDGDFDYATVAGIPADARFDLAVANQVLEHMPVAEAIDLVGGVAQTLRPGGRFAATVPNPAHPVRQWGDATHVTAWPVFDFYGLFRLAGLEVESYARYGKRRLPWRPIRRMVVLAAAREFRLDWCDSLVIVARRPSGS